MLLPWRITTIFVSHDIEDAADIGDKIVIIRKGKIVQQDTKDTILNNPASGYVSGLISG
ncbi:MAG: hypothetical protein ACOCQ5_03920 [Halanaerobiales bacterium]